MTKMLASVKSADEARIALESGADIVDLKDPLMGALGALPLVTIMEIVALVGHRRPVSATIGDMPMQPDLLVDAVQKTAATGVDIVKVGFFGDEGHEACINALAPVAAQGVRIVAVLFADAEPAFGLLPLLSDSRFYGVMLDTSSKNGRRLGACLDEEALRFFVDDARSLGLVSGLAGSLAASDIPRLVEVGPDYLGFRGALCCNADRKAGMEHDRMKALAALLYSCNMASPALA
jgi:uncharacterized protein (UPF0264 family)